MISIKGFSLSIILLSLLISLSSADSIDGQTVNPGPWSQEGPHEGDIIQGANGDCAFLSTMAVILRKDAAALTNAIAPIQTKQWPITFYLRDNSLHTFYLDEKTPQEHEQMTLSNNQKLSRTQWVAYFERAREMWLDLHNVPWGERGNTAESFKMFYGFDPPDQTQCFVCNMSHNIEEVKKYPMIFASKGQPQWDATPDSIGKHIVLGHAYAFHDGNSTHIILRNPWGMVLQKGETQSDMPDGVEKMDNLGTFSITIDEAAKVCAVVCHVKTPDGGTKYVEAVGAQASVVASVQAQESAYTYDTALDPFQSLKIRGIAQISTQRNEATTTSYTSLDTSSIPMTVVRGGSPVKASYLNAPGL